MWFWLVIWITILVFNAVHSFLPNKLQGKQWIRIAAMIIASLILIKGVFQEVAAVRNRSYANVTPDGQITKSNNFPWKITKTKDRDGNIIYIINGRQGDSTAISVFPDNSTKKYFVRNAYDGMAIVFTCAEEEISNFTIKVKN